MSLVLRGFLVGGLARFMLYCREMKFCVFGRVHFWGAFYSFFGAVCASMLIFGTADGQIIPANCRTIWQGNVGVPGGIPNRQTIYTNIAAGASGATIQAALNLCPSNQVVMLAAGTYNISNTLHLNQFGVVLRGAGTGLTFMTNSGSPAIIVGDDGWYPEWQVPVTNHHVSWVGGYTPGTASIQVADANTFQAGYLIFLDQLNDTNVNVVGACGVPPGMMYTSVQSPNLGTNRWDFQLNRIASIVGNTLNLTEPICYPFDSTLTPEAWHFSSQPGAVMSGVEDLMLIYPGGPGSGGWEGVDLHNCFGCWVKNVEVQNYRKGVSTMVALRCEVRHSYWPGPKTTTDDYCVEAMKADGLVVEDNIFNCPGTAAVLMGVHGSVFSYNYGTNITGSGTSMQGGFDTHGGNSFMNLFEGNVIPGWWIEDCWGSSVYNTALRNRFTGIDEAKLGVLNNDIQAINFGKFQRFMNVVGNVLGTTGVNTWYEDSGTNYTCHTTGRIYLIGESSGGCSTDFDPITYNTLLRAVNWDCVTSTNGGIVSGGYGINDVPNSLYLTNKPSWFGFLPWPPVDPTNPTYSSSRTNIPAAYRFIYGVDPPLASELPPPTSLHVAPQ